MILNSKNKTVKPRKFKKLFKFLTVSEWLLTVAISKINIGQIMTASGPHYAIKVKIYEAEETKPNICQGKYLDKTPLSPLSLWNSLRTTEDLIVRNTSYCSQIDQLPRDVVFHNKTQQLFLLLVFVKSNFVKKYFLSCPNFYT